MSDDIFGSDFERRVLGHCPRWWPADATVPVGSDFKDGVDDEGEPTREPAKVEQVPVEEHMREVNGHADDWSMPGSILVEDLRKRVVADEYAPSPSTNELEPVLLSLAEKGLIDRAGDAVSMSEAGLLALTAQTEE